MKIMNRYERLPLNENMGPTSTLPALIAKRGLIRMMNYYHRASDYYKDNGAQSSSQNYGGSRSSLYGQLVVAESSSLKDVIAARKEFKAMYGDYSLHSDELGAALRMVGYLVRSVPGLNEYFINRVRLDDGPMVGADFVFPEGYVPILDHFTTSQDLSLEMTLP